MNAVEDGRYLYCVVRLPEGSNPEFDATGVGGEPVELVATDRLGAVVHAGAAAFDGSDVEELRRWLLAHQSVVDDAGERFGTPLPVQFGTVLEGGTGSVREWLERESTALSDALESLAGQWEYRIELEWDESALDPEADGDEKLRDIDDRLADASEGESYLLERRRDRRQTQLHRERRAELAESLRGRLAAIAAEVRELEEHRVDVEGGGGTTSVDLRLAVLAPRDREDEIGETLDAVDADTETLRFTGPWPPYTFAPELDE